MVCGKLKQSSRTTLVKIVAGRMLIIGVINIFLITVILISMAYIYQKSMIEMVLYGLIPFNYFLHLLSFYMCEKQDKR